MDFSIRQGQAEHRMAKQYPGTTRAPEFPASLTWFNTDRPLSLRDLHGRIVILDFWTYG